MVLETDCCSITWSVRLMFGETNQSEYRTSGPGSEDLTIDVVLSAKGTRKVEMEGGGGVQGAGRKQRQ